MEQTSTRMVVQAVAACIALGALIYAVLALDIGRSADVTDYESCVAAGFPIMESYPEQCADGAGNTYTRVIDGPKAEDMISVEMPAAGDAVSSPVEVRGVARGGWYFEASFPVEVRDSAGAVIGAGPAQAEGEWMTNEFVPFFARIPFATTTATSGVIRFKNDNPSGLPENDRHIDIPVLFKKAAK